eukprot:EG_transcript_5923
MVLTCKPTDPSLLFPTDAPRPLLGAAYSSRVKVQRSELFSLGSLRPGGSPPRLPHSSRPRPRLKDEVLGVGGLAPDFAGSGLAPEMEEPADVSVDLLGNGLFLAGLAGAVSMFLIRQREQVALATYTAGLEESPGDEPADSSPPCSPTSPLPPLPGDSPRFDAERDPVRLARRPKEDLWRLMGLGTALCLLVGTVYRRAMLQAPAYALSVVFIAGYLGIICEEHIAFNKAGLGLLMAAALWAIRNATSDPLLVHHELHAALAETGEVVFFLLGAMSIVQIVEAHNGWSIITNNIKTRNKALLAWLLAFVTFWMSAVLDNLTSTVVMLSLLRKVIPAGELRRLFGAIIVLAANAGGAWTPIGDVTTTMLWINGLITTLPTMYSLFLPSVVSVAVPLALMTLTLPDLRGSLPPLDPQRQKPQLAPRGRLVLACGVLALILVPAFKTVTGLPPYLGMLTSLGLLWLLTDVLHYGDAARRDLRAPAALSRIDTEGVLFFFGVLMSVACLNSAGILAALSQWLSSHLPYKAVLAGAIGLASAVVDNVPLVAAVMGMFTKAAVPVNDMFWQLVAYCAGTGGSILVIGSAAGVAYMGMEQVEFGWYTRRISFFALMGYAAGMAVYFALRTFLPVPLV